MSLVRAAASSGREFVMKDAYSAHASVEDLETYYPVVCEAYRAVIRRCGLDVAVVRADVGMMGGSAAEWPTSPTRTRAPPAPFEVYLVGLDLERDAVRAEAESVSASLVTARIETLCDDRPERAGVKFTDADLLGMPLRITVSRRSIEGGGVELKGRGGGGIELAPAAAIADHVGARLRTLVQALGPATPRPQ